MDFAIGFVLLHCFQDWLRRTQRRKQGMPDIVMPADKQRIKLARIIDQLRKVRRTRHQIKHAEVMYQPGKHRFITIDAGEFAGQDPAQGRDMGRVLPQFA